MQTVVFLIATLLGLAGLLSSISAQIGDTRGSCASSLENVSTAFYQSEVVQISGFLIHFKCPKGWKLIGQEHAACSDNCTSSIAIPRCVANTCAMPQIIDDENVEHPTFAGNVTESIFPCGSSVTYSCKPGFELTGNPVHICQEDGIWEKSTFQCTPKPTCKEADLCVVKAQRCFLSAKYPDDCLDASIPNGNRTFYPGDRVHYKKCLNTEDCLRGPKVVTCLQSGRWSECPECKLVECQVPPINESVIYIMRSDKMKMYHKDGMNLVPAGYGLNFCCQNKTHTMKGEAHIECLCDTGDWSGKPPTCAACEHGPCESCYEPFGLENYDFTVEQEYNPYSKYFSVNSVIKITGCKRGYARGGNIKEKTLICRKGIVEGANWWDGELPMCEEDCPTLPNTFPGRSYYIDEEPSAHRWIKTKSPSDRYPGTTLHYKCYAGTHICHGNPTRTCINGHWTGTEPGCCKPLCCAEPICPTVKPQLELSVIASSEIRTRYDGVRQYDLNGTISWKCKDGYRDFQGQMVTTCIFDHQSNQMKWDVEPGYCIPINQPAVRSAPTAKQTRRYCRKPTKPQYGSEKVTRINPLSSDSDARFEAGDMISYTCADPRFIMGIDNIACQANGKWSSHPPHCVEDPYCTTPSFETNATKSFATMTIADEPNLFVVDSTIYYRCQDDQYMVGESSITCRIDGSWSGKPGLCFNRNEATACPLPTEPNNGRLVSQTSEARLPGTRFIYECDEGYRPIGESRLICQADGTWSPASPPRCELNADQGKPIRCSTPPKPTNLMSAHGTLTVIGNSNLFVPGGDIVYRCEEGYSPIGTHRIICQEDGSWTSEPPQCLITATKVIHRI